MLERAVKSVLAQDYPEFQLVVVADGEKIRLPFKDDRLTVFELKENHGAYFAQSVSLAANPYGWYAPHGSDDWTDPDHLSHLRSIRDTAVPAGSVWWHKGNEPPSVHPARYEVGVYTTERLREIGGYNPAERMGQDSLMLKVLSLAGSMTLSTKTTYHRVRRPGSLTTAPATKIGSPARNAMRARNREIYQRVLQAKDLKQLRKIRRSAVPAEVQDAVERYADELRGLLG